MKDKYIVIKKSDVKELCTSMQASLKHILETIEFSRSNKPLNVEVKEL